MKVPKLLRLIFIKETLVLIFGFVSLWFSIGLYVDSHYKIQDLKPHVGTIEKLDSIIVRVKDKPLFKEVTKELQLELSADNNVYTVLTTENFENIISNVGVGDTITLYTKPKLWGIFGLKKTSAINHLTKSGEVIIDYNSYKSSISGLFYMTLIFSLILFIVYIVQIRKRIWWDFDGYKRSTSSA